MHSASYDGLLPEQRTLALKAPAVTRELVIATDDAVARNGKRDRVGGASVSNHARRSLGVNAVDQTGQVHVAYCFSRRDRANFLPHTALKRRPTHIEREVKPIGRLVHKTNYLYQIVADRDSIRNERRFGKAVREIRFQFVRIIAEQKSANALGAACDQHLAHRAMADPVEENVDGRL